VLQRIVVQLQAVLPSRTLVHMLLLRCRRREASADFVIDNVNLSRPWILTVAAGHPCAQLAWVLTALYFAGSAYTPPPVQPIYTVLI
jgi:hypothetical protein